MFSFKSKSNDKGTMNGGSLNNWSNHSPVSTPSPFYDHTAAIDNRNINEEADIEDDDNSSSNNNSEGAFIPMCHCAPYITPPRGPTDIFSTITISEYEQLQNEAIEEYNKITEDDLRMKRCIRYGDEGMDYQDANTNGYVKCFIYHLPQSERVDSWKARRSVWKPAPMHDEYWDGDEMDFRPKPLTSDEFKNLMRQKRIKTLPQTAQNLLKFYSKVFKKSSKTLQDADMLGVAPNVGMVSMADITDEREANNADSDDIPSNPATSLSKKGSASSIMEGLWKSSRRDSPQNAVIPSPPAQRESSLSKSQVKQLNDTKLNSNETQNRETRSSGLRSSLRNSLTTTTNDLQTTSRPKSISSKGIVLEKPKEVVFILPEKNPEPSEMTNEMTASTSQEEQNASKSENGDTNANVEANTTTVIETEEPIVEKREVVINDEASSVSARSYLGTVEESLTEVDEHQNNQENGETAQISNDNQSTGDSSSLVNERPNSTTSALSQTLSEGFKSLQDVLAAAAANGDTRKTSDGRVLASLIPEALKTRLSNLQFTTQVEEVLAPVTERPSLVNDNDALDVGIASKKRNWKSKRYSKNKVWSSHIRREYQIDPKALPFFWQYNNTSFLILFLLTIVSLIAKYLFPYLNWSNLFIQIVIFTITFFISGLLLLGMWLMNDPL